MACTQKYSLSYTDFFFTPPLSFPSHSLQFFQLLSLFDSLLFSILSSLFLSYVSSSSLLWAGGAPRAGGGRLSAAANEAAAVTPWAGDGRDWLGGARVQNLNQNFEISDQNFRNFGSIGPHWYDIISAELFSFFFIFREFGNIWFKFYSKIHIILIRSFQNFGNSSISATPRTNDQNERLNLKFPKTIRSNF